VTVVPVLLIASALLGCATGLFFQVWALVPISLMTAILPAIVLQARGFGSGTGILITIGCLVISQLAYIATGLILFGSPKAESLAKKVDDDPGGRGEPDVRREDE
jgi:uncharacterized membrane protein YkgB